MWKESAFNANEIKNGKETEKAVRSRVVGTESVNFLHQYLVHIFEVCGWSEEMATNKKYVNIGNLYSELSEIIYTDCIPRICNLKSTQSLI